MASAGQAAPISLSHHETLQRLNIQRAGADTSQKIGVAGPVDMSFDALGRSFELQLTPNSRLLDAARGVTGKNVIPYLGKLAGNDKSWVRIVTVDGTPSGLIWDGNELYAIERPGDNAVGADSTIIYRLADAVIEPGSMTCGADGSPISGSAVVEKLASELSVTSSEAAGAVSEIDIGIVADPEFYARHGDNSNARIVERMSLVDGYYSEQVGIQINWPLVQIFTNPATDPFTDTVTVDSAVTDNLLVQLADYRESEPNQYANGLTHLWTGRNIEGSGGNNTTVGVAYNGALCSRRFGTGLSEGRGSAFFDSLVAAHEIGHNFGAPHDGTAPCESVDVTLNDYLMEPSLNNSSRFSQCSLDQMADDIARASCITPLPSVDMTIGLTDPTPTALLGNAATVTFDVANAGTLPATNVAATITLPTNISLISAAPSMGTCADGGGVVNCAIGDVPGSTTVQVVLTSDTTTVGSGIFAASVTATDDDDPTNNQNSVTLTVQPAVNLGITPPSAQRIDVAQSTGLTALIENTSILDATGVTLSITLSAGLRADSASWSLGNCTVSSSQIDCAGATFGAQSNTTLSIGVTGTTEGSKSLSFSMSSAELDADTGNNSATATVNVGSPQQNDSGGGSTSLWLLSLLGLLAVRRRAYWMKLSP